MNSNPLPPIHVPSLLEKYQIRPSKGLGQNFLVDENSLKKVIKAAEISAEDVVLEIGPGLGSLTRHLAVRCRKVIAVELDERMLPALHETLDPFDNIDIVLGDILDLQPKNLLFDQSLDESKLLHYKVVANIPYYITSALIRHLLEADIQPKTIVLTVQKEVAQRICEKPPKMSLLALSVQVYGRPIIKETIPSGAFYPSPKIDSSVIKINIYPEPLITNDLLPIFFRLAKAGFSQKRKTLRNSLSAGMGWSKEKIASVLNSAGIDPQRRAQTLSIEEWEALTKNTDIDCK